MVKVEREFCYKETCWMSFSTFWVKSWNHSFLGVSNPAGNFMLKVNNKNARKVWNMFKVNNEDTTTPMASFWCLCCWLWSSFTPFLNVSIINFEQANVGRESISLKVKIRSIIFHDFFAMTNRNSLSEVFCKKVVLKIFSEFTGKHC